MHSSQANVCVVCVVCVEAMVGVGRRGGGRGWAASGIYGMVWKWRETGRGEQADEREYGRLRAVLSPERHQDLQLPPACAGSVYGMHVKKKGNVGGQGLGGDRIGIGVGTQGWRESAWSWAPHTCAVVKFSPRRSTSLNRAGIFVLEADPALPGSSLK